LTTVNTRRRRARYGAESVCRRSIRAIVAVPFPASLLFQPVRLMPQPVVGQLLARVLNETLAPLIDDGDLDFLRRRRLAVTVTDLARTWCFTLGNRGLALSVDGDPEAVIVGSARDLLMLAGRRLDPDTLFFKRRLRIEGDTELGLQVKNVLDRLDLADLPAPLRWALARSARLLEHMA
jgi:O2-independent ubiquinone biosynthesis accessory factor UbiT